MPCSVPCSSSFAHADDSDVRHQMRNRNHKVCVSARSGSGVATSAENRVSGSLGLAEDPSNFAISCSQVGPIEIPAKLPKQANVFRESTSVFFKATRVTRIWDAKRNTLVYLAVSRRLVDGSPFNAISTVPVKQ
ncbi:MAG: CreA family protein [Bilophila wadsworthia]